MADFGDPLSSLSVSSILYFFHHVFLPPKLPNGDDSSSENDNDNLLIHLLETCLEEFSAHLENSASESQVVRAVIVMIHNLRVVRDSQGHVDEEALRLAMVRSAISGGIIPLEVAEQNSGVIINVQNDGPTIFEVFELAPTNQAVMSTVGRLTRKFPALAVAVPRETYDNAEFQAAIAKTLATMSHQAVPAMKPKTLKSKQKIVEDRDTNVPHVVTELFTSILLGVGSPTGVTTVTKNTREEIMWKSSRLPWKRSPTWLLVRVALQLAFTRSSSSRQLYKEFMVFFLSRIVDEAVSKSLDSDVLHVMYSKVSRRLLKIPSSEGYSWLPSVHRRIERATKTVDTRWCLIRKLEEPRLNLMVPSNLSLENGMNYQLPDLEDFIRLIKERKVMGTASSFAPECRLQLYPSSLSFPSGLLGRTEDDYQIFRLKTFESWVSVKLNEWLKKNTNSSEAGHQMAEALLAYHKEARDLYSGHPENMSHMLLTVLQLWVAMDKLICGRLPLLRDYDHEIPAQVFQCLILARAEDMKRLSINEKYLQDRHRHYRKKTYPSVFRSYGMSNSFQARYFCQDSQLPKLMESINAQALSDRNEKIKELERMQQKYRKLMERHDSLPCSYVTLFNRRGYPYSAHSWNCPRCQAKKEANELSICVHEWPLPQDLASAQCTVFELNPPPDFCTWRDTTWYLIFDVLLSKPDSKTSPKTRYPLEAYAGLTKWQLSTRAGRIHLLSESKPHIRTHRKEHLIPYITVDDVCVNNGLQLHYFDRDNVMFVSPTSPTTQVSAFCTMQLPSRSSELQRFLQRSFDRPKGETPNQAIASQHLCPSHLSLPEGRSLMSLAYGCNTLWLNILTRLSSPDVDFTKIETVTFLFQLTLQAGPQSDDGNHRRSSHKRLIKEKFCHALCDALRASVSRIQENRESYFGMWAFSVIAARALSLSTSTAEQLGFRDLLDHVRGILHQWTSLWTRKYHEAVEDEQRNQLRRMAVDVALICSDTFNLDHDHLQVILSRARDTSILLEMAMLIHDHVDHGSYGEGDELRALLFDRWQSLMHRSSGLFMAQITGHGQESLDQAVCRHWPAFSSGAGWSTSVSAPYWLETCSDDLQVHFNTLNGRLLVNGRPLSRLPHEFETHHDYRRIFGQAVLEVMPSSVPGLQYSGKRALAGYELHFGIQVESPGLSGDLMLHAKNDCSSTDLVPQRLLRTWLPEKFVDDFSHWYRHDNGGDHTIEFRPLADPWTSRPGNWHLIKRKGGPWQLAQGQDQRLINPCNDVIACVARVLAPLETLLYMHFVYDLKNQQLRIELPRLKMVFMAKPGTSSIKSEQFRGMQVDEDQSIGTLVGLKSKLILREDGGLNCRVAIVPEGRVRWQRTRLSEASGGGGTYTRVSIYHGTASRVQRYGIDTRLGRLVHRGTLQSMLFLARMHALTSFCLPDPLTQHTGTEQALQILSSQATRSFGTLGDESVRLLGHIRELSPPRQFYPDHIKSMQTVDWDPDTSFLSQHGLFYRLATEIYQEAENTSFLYPNREMASLEPHDINASLLDRDLVRSAGLRVDGFGAELFTTSQDVVYKSRDGGHLSSSSSPAAAAVKARVSAKTAQRAYERTRVLTERCDANLLDSLYETLRGSSVASPGTRATPSQIQYDAEWLDKPENRLSAVWCSLPTRSQSCDRFTLMIWLASIAFSNQDLQQTIQVMHTLLFCPEIMGISIPVDESLDLSQGYRVKRGALEKAARQAIKPFEQCPESNLIAHVGESDIDHDRRCQAQYESQVSKAVESFADELQSQWPNSLPARPSGHLINLYMDAEAAVRGVSTVWHEWYKNSRFRTYLGDVIRCMESLPVHPVQVPSFPQVPVLQSAPRSRTYIPERELYTRKVSTEFVSEPPRLDLDAILCPRTPPTQGVGRSTEALIEKLDAQTNAEYQTQYLSELRESVQSLRQHTSQQKLKVSFQNMEKTLQQYRQECQVKCDAVYASLFHELGLLPPASDSQSQKKHGWLGLDAAAIIELTQLLPRRSPVGFLQQLQKSRWNQLPGTWRKKLITYGVALAGLQRASRLVQSCEDRNELEVIRELQNQGHEEWDPEENPEWLLMECESDFLMRRVQQQIARQMINPPEGKNATMQLNMGEGKSSVIVPAVTTALADGSQLVRVVVAKPQSRQMHQILTMRLGGLVGRKVYHLPIARNVVLSLGQAHGIRRVLERCMKDGGILLVQPEHILSFQLMGLERTLSRKPEDCHTGRFLLETQRFLDAKSRDVVDESDENFSVKFELIYTIGDQSTVEHSPVRWAVAQQIFGLLEKIAPGVESAYPDGLEVHHWQGRTHQYPRIRVFAPEALRELLVQLSSRICALGFENFPIARQTDQVKDAVHRYILEPLLTPEDMAAVEQSSFWTDSVISTVFLLRGLIAGGVIGFVLGQKRWRVNYGVDPNRIPRTMLAVPFRAKDSPAPRAEFSHPDVVISLTCLSYYYQGLSDDELFDAFDRLKRDDQAEPEYQDWVKRAASTLPSGFHELAGVNIRDRAQCVAEIFPHLRYSKGAIDYYVSKIIFAREMREFAQKLSSSGWDLAKAKDHPTTGFSGTNDSRYVLPLSVKQLDSPEQRHTNALVLERLMQPENCVVTMPKRGATSMSAGEVVSEGSALLNIVTQLKPEVRVILDVGAQVIDLVNIEVSTMWLELVRNTQQQQQQQQHHDSLPEAVIFFDDDDTLSVVDMLGRVEPLQTSQYKDQTDRCLVFLDEAHTRGTDLKLPSNYRAAVTLGANLTKDRLVQACMRMRKLGLGQSVVLCVPDEIRVSIVQQRMGGTHPISPAAEDHGRELTVSEVLTWSVTQTLHELERSIPLWATQGLRFHAHEKVRQGGDRFTPEWAEKFLEPDCQSLEQRYRPGDAGVSSMSELTANSGSHGSQIAEHCERFGQISLRAASLQEEQERELCPEAEEERQVERPPPAKARAHKIHQRVRDFIRGQKSGFYFSTTSDGFGDDGFLSAFSTLNDTNAASYLSVDMFPRDLIVTGDFARTVERLGAHAGKSDLFQRPVQWILQTVGKPGQLVIISPYEAEILLPEIEDSQHVTLRLYTPRTSAAHKSLDRLDLYIVPEHEGQLPASSPFEAAAAAAAPPPAEQVLWLNILAGQLYMASLQEYAAICDSLGIASSSSTTTSDEGATAAAVEADGFIPPGLVVYSSKTGLKMENRSRFTQSPTRFLQALLTRVRRPSEGIEKTHMGRLLNGVILTEDDFVLR